MLELAEFLEPKLGTIFFLTRNLSILGSKNVNTASALNLEQESNIQTIHLLYVDILEEKVYHLHHLYFDISTPTLS